MNLKMSLIFILSLMVSHNVFSSGCSSRSEQVERYKKLNKELQATNAAQAEQIVALEAELESCETDFSREKQAKQMLEVRYDGLESEYDQLEEDYYELADYTAGVMLELEDTQNDLEFWVTAYGALFDIYSGTMNTLEEFYVINWKTSENCIPSTSSPHYSAFTSIRDNIRTNIIAYLFDNFEVFAAVPESSVSSYSTHHNVYGNFAQFEYATSPDLPTQITAGWFDNSSLYPMIIRITEEQEDTFQDLVALSEAYGEAAEAIWASIFLPFTVDECVKFETGNLEDFLSDYIAE